MSIYNCHSIATGDFRIVKWDEDLNIQNIYQLYPGRGGMYHCQCFQGGKPSCRHREMLKVFLYYEKVDSTTFLDFDRNFWVEPLKKVLDIARQKCDDVQ